MRMVRRSVALAVAVAALSLGLSGYQPIEAQVAGAKAPAKFRGRLPAYYSQVVNQQQRAAIYRIQFSYSERIEALQAQLEQLKNTQQAEIRAVLTPEQQKRVDELTTAAKMKRAGKAAAANAPGAPAAVPAAAAAKGGK